MSTLKASVLAMMIPLAFAAPAIAQDRGHGGPRMMFEELDANNDGAVTLEEMEAAREGRFARADANGDGQLTRDELVAAGQDRIEDRVDRMIERADANEDGQISEEEMAEMRGSRRGPDPERMFNRMDADGDGQVTEAEFDEAVARFMERRGGGDRGHGHDRDRG